MAASLGLDLIFDVQTGGAHLGEGFHGAGDVERAAPACIRIHEKRQGAGIGNPADVGQHVIHAADPEVGNAERSCGDAAARQIQRFEAACGRHSRGIGVDGADDLQRPLVGHSRAKTRTGGIILVHRTCLHR